jgi:protein tyrosine phosphatase (PTP) superfamily phosphohydrolase (DUF442 family)
MTDKFKTVLMMDKRQKVLANLTRDCARAEEVRKKQFAAIVRHRPDGEQARRAR